jgi:signal peptidase I
VTSNNNEDSQREENPTLIGIPPTEQLESELRWEHYKIRYKYVLRSTISLLVVAAAAAILVVTLWMPVLEVYGKSMTPTLESGEISFSRATS